MPPPYEPEIPVTDIDTQTFVKITPASETTTPLEPAARPGSSFKSCFMVFGSTFWTIASLISLTVNIVLVVAVIYLGSQLGTIKRIVKDDVLAGLYANFILMDQATIKTTIPINTQVPAKFDLPLDTDTVVTLIEDTSIPGARVSLSTGGLSIQDAPTDIILPAGTRLPIHLTLTVPVDQKIPVKMNVEVNIPLNQTDLHTPFVGLKNVVAPYYNMMDQVPDSLSEAVCGKTPEPLCKSLVP
jgi:hypothetical protein